MIRIEKPTSVPAELAERGRVATEVLCRKVESGTKEKLSFDQRIYGSPQVKQALAAAQHDKCCFCESKVSHVAYGDVEHFRPKAAVRSSPQSQERTHGYYWLAYQWSNLYFACEQCNRRHKRNMFPLQDEDARVVSHHDAELLPRERPLYIDPGSEDPESLIGFRREYAKARSGDGLPRALTTVEELGLNRPALCDRRRDRRALLLTLLRNIRSWLAAGCPEEYRSMAEQSLGLVLDAMKNQAEYTAMARCIVRAVIPWRDLDPDARPRRLLAQFEDDALEARWFAIPPR